MDRNKVLIAAAVALVYASSFGPSDWVLGHGMRWLGNPAYEGVGILLPHLLLYSTLTAALAALAWFGLVWAKALPGPQMAINGRVAAWGVVGGLVSVVAALAWLYATHMGALQWVGLDPWLIGANMVSNFLEEFIFRGFLLVALTALLGFWPAAVLTSLAFGFGHEQYPVVLQLLVSTLGLGWCWIARQARSLWAPWTAHAVLDLIVDAIWA